MITNDDIREVFLAAGFTVKEGQADLKPYVFQAARMLLALKASRDAAEPITRAQWIKAAQAFYMQAGDDEKTAAECALYICNQQDWASGQEIGDPRLEAQEDVRGRDRPMIPGRLPATCDGIEQEAFEAWGKRERYNMEQHPLHYLFLNSETAAARDGWKAGLQHAVSRVRSA